MDDFDTTIMTAAENDKAMLFYQALQDRISRNENALTDSIRRMEEKLDRIVELGKTVAVLQEQWSRFAETTADMRSRLSAIEAKVDANAQAVSEQLSSVASRAEDSANKARKRADEVHQDVAKWLNRGWGMWVIASIVFTIASSLFYRWLDLIDRDRASLVQFIEASRKNDIVFEQRLIEVEKKLDEIRQKPL